LVDPSDDPIVFLIAWVIGMILGLTGPGTAFHVIAVMPFFIWEVVLGLWLTVRGFNEQSSIAVADRAARRATETMGRESALLSAETGAA
jgi:hypothetical protein